MMPFPLHWERQCVPMISMKVFIYAFCSPFDINLIRYIVSKYERNKQLNEESGKERG